MVPLLMANGGNDVVVDTGESVQMYEVCVRVDLGHHESAAMHACVGLSRRK